MPNALTLRIPDEAWQVQTQPGQWTMRRLLQAAGIDLPMVAMWQIYGAAYDGMQGASPVFDQPIPAPPSGVDPSIFVYVNLPQAAPMPQMMPAQPMQPPAGSTAAHGDVYERIDADWNAILEIENEIKGLRKSIIDMMARLKSLNRDLNTDERTHADSMDTRDWLEARRSLRDAGLRLAVCIKEVDMGDVSSAGQRSWFEGIHQQYIVPRLPFDNMQQAQDSFSYHRKTLSTLQSTMSNTLQHARNSAERRAQQVLNRIAAKVRDAQTRKNFLGAMFDSH
jgi:hypothetical protein